MSELRFDFEWESPEGARAPELRATWARLRILADGQLVTQVEDRIAHSIRDAIYGPLYPLTEWIVTNWWSLSYELASPTRMGIDSYARRHDIRYAAEGFALPHLQLRPEGQRVFVHWTPAQMPECRINFLSEGSVYLDRNQVEDALRGVVNAVVSRLQDEGVPETLLADEWEAICTTDPEEAKFCKAAGLLGSDPYALEEPDVGALLAVAEALPFGVMEEFLAVAEREQLKAHGMLLRRFIERAAARSDVRLPLLEKLRVEEFSCKANQVPWAHGYELARTLRERVRANGKRIDSVSRLGEVLKLNPSSWRRATSAQTVSVPHIDAVVATTHTDSPYFAIERRHPQGKIFALCRALCAYLTEPDETAAVVTAAYSERQKRNRAFAAELIAPADDLRAHITSRVVAPEEIQELAAEFGTSELVIRHQIENHGIARVAEDWSGNVDARTGSVRESS